ncbi:MAG: hypothetical protein ACOVOF_11165 [Chryseotalea sp.]|jgi:hypothetical protein
MKQPDKLFRDKLYNHSAQAPANAWEKIEKNLPVNRINWWAIAAMLTPLLLAGTYYYFSLKEETKQTIAQQSTIENPSNKEQTDSKSNVTLDSIRANMEKETPLKKNTEPNRTKPDKNKNVKKDKTDKRNNLPAHIINIAKENYIVSEENIVLPNNQPETKILTTSTEETKQTTTNTITLVYTTNDLREKYLLKKENKDATSESKDASSIQKLLQKAGELTTNQSPIAQLRSKKNEILALNFRNEKSERNK